ncbi:hypothetical protein, partial [Vibrio splendidus]|uniref:hypothetical protein n=1 Tax=Vibrio splendidus TaxID=29497 RepID=UPI003D10C1FC
CYLFVICLFLGKDFTYISSNTKKIESLISVFEKRFDGKIKVVRNESNISAIELNYTRKDVVNFINEFSYTVD